MTTKFQASEKVTKNDLFVMSPMDIDVNDELRGRCQAVASEKLIQMAESLLEHGQRQPCEARKNKDGKLTLTLGFTRLEAARLIRQGFTDSQGVFRQNSDFRVKVMLCNTTDDDAFVHNIIENAHRNQTSPIDDAQNHSKLREKGKKDAEITRLYGYKSQATVTRLKKILGLEVEFQDLIHAGKMTLGAGLDLLDVPGEARAEIVKEATNKNGEVNAGKLRDLVREYLQKQKEAGAGGDDTEENSTTDAPVEKTDTTVTKSRKLTEIRRFVSGLMNLDGDVRALGKALWAFMTGEAGEESTLQALVTLLDAPMPVKAEDQPESAPAPVNTGLRTAVAKVEEGWAFEVIRGEDEIVHREEGFPNAEEAQDAADKWILNQAL